MLKFDADALEENEVLFFIKSGDVMFYYDRGSRAANVARELLGGYKGNVQTDGYAAYDQFEEKSGISAA